MLRARRAPRIATLPPQCASGALASRRSVAAFLVRL
jgi:hypothetical protein